MPDDPELEDGWYYDPDPELEDLPVQKETKPIKISRPILWQDKTGKYVVIEGPFPNGFVRSADARSVHQASVRQPYTELGEILARPGTESGKRYAKTLKQYVDEVENEWGPVGY